MAHVPCFGFMCDSCVLRVRLACAVYGFVYASCVCCLGPLGRFLASCKLRLGFVWASCGLRGCGVSIQFTDIARVLTFNARSAAPCEQRLRLHPHDAIKYAIGSKCPNNAACPTPIPRRFMHLPPWNGHWTMYLQ